MIVNITMMINALSSSFSASAVDDVLNYAIRFQKPCGFIIVVLDHPQEQQTHIADLTSQLFPLLKKNVRPTDTILRFSHDCWLICLDECDDRLLRWAQYVLQSLLNRHSAQITSPLEGALTLVKSTPLQAQNLSQAMETIEQEVQFAKSSLHRLKMIRSTALNSEEAPAEDSTHFVSFIHRAILDNRLFLAFQPIVKSTSGDLYYYECLARILNEEGKIVPAGQFISGCEKAGLIQLVDQKMQQLAVEELMSDRHLRLAINVSAITATDSTWLNTLKAQITARPDLRDRLMVELTETSVFYDIDESIRFISQLRDLGCKVSIDDFGSGYMSLTYLKSDLVQVVKIDAQFVKNLKQNSNSLYFIRAIMALTQPHGIQCVAEGVEDAESMAILAGEGVNYLQGYYIGKPLPFRKWM